MAKVNVQFSDASHSEIISVFGCAQDPEAFPNQWQIDVTDEAYATYFDSLPQWAQQGLPRPA